jgi:carbamoyl-phosphate synthase large subunit
MKRKALFTGGGGSGAEAIYRYLSPKYDLYFGDSVAERINPVIPSHRAIMLPWASDPSFTSQVQNICNELSIDFLIPAVDEELLTLAASFDQSATRLILPSPRFVDTMLDKFTMIEALLAKNILAPKTLPFDGNFFRLDFPCICKPRAGRGSRNITYLYSRNEALRFREFLSFSNNPSHFIIQELVKGVEYTVQMIADGEARLRAVLPVEVAVKKGITIDARINKNKSVVNACQAIHDKIPTPGIYNIQLILTRDGRVFPFEINPRISTTFCLALAAGIDPLEIFDANRKSPKTILDYTDRARIQRFWHNHISV